MLALSTTPREPRKLCSSRRPRLCPLFSQLRVTLLILRRVHRRCRHPLPRQRRAHFRSSPRLHLGSSFPRLGKLQPPPSGLTTSRDLHHVADAKNSALFAELCELHGTFSEVLQQLRGSHHGASIKARLLSKVSDTTAARYLRSVQLFFSAFEELGGQLSDIDQGLFLDAFFALSRSTEDGPLSNSQNVIKALRWYKKLLGLSCLPDLYGPAFSLLGSAATQEKRESIPLPLCFLAFLERTLLSGSASLEVCIWAGSFLVAISASLRFADSQHIRWSSLCVSHFTLRGICFRTKATQRGAPFGLISFGVASSCGTHSGPALVRRRIPIACSFFGTNQVFFARFVLTDSGQAT